MIKRIIIILIICVSFNNLLKAQDFNLSLYDAAPLFLNPSLTGLTDADWRVHSQYRTQWSAVNFKPFTTALISFDLPYKKWGFGAQIINSRAGFGNFNALQAIVSAAYTLSIDDNKYHNISFGLQAGATQKTIEHQLLTFDNQYTSLNGGSFNSSISNGEAFSGQSLNQANLNAGGMYYYSKQQSRLNPFIGGSIFNLLQPRETLLEQSNSLPIRYYIHAGTRVNITELFYLIPKVLIARQENFREETYALDAGYYLKWSEIHLLGGLIYRNRDAIVPSIGAKKDNYIAKLSYDFNTSSLAGASGSRKPKVRKICPRL